MPLITSIKPQRNGKRVNVYLDGKFGFGIDLDNFVTLGLKVEQELSEKEVKDIVKKGEIQKTSDKLLRFATLRPRSEKEIRDYLKRKKVHESLYRKLIDKLNRLELLDDEKFAKWWIEQRQTFSPKAKRILNYELRTKGIKKEIIDKVIGETDVDEVKIAHNLLEKREYRWKSFKQNVVRQKKTRFLLSKGFNWEVIEKVLKERN